MQKQMTSIRAIEAGFTSEITDYDQELAELKALRCCETVPLAEPIRPDDVIAYRDDRGRWWAVRADMAAADYIETASLDDRPHWLTDEGGIFWDEVGSDELCTWVDSDDVQAVMIG